MEKICEGTYASAISRRLRMIERHLRVKDLGGFFPNTPFILLICVNKLLEYASADEVYNFASALYVVDMTRRLELVAGKVLI